MAKGLDRNFLEYGIRKNDLAIISQLCEKHNLDEEWVKNLLRSFHEENVKQVEVRDKDVEKIINKALQLLHA